MTIQPHYKKFLHLHFILVRVSSSYYNKGRNKIFRIRNTYFFHVIRIIFSFAHAQLLFLTI